jgi:replicative DNA helicase
LRTGKLTDDEWPRLTEAIERLRTVSLHIDETPGLTPSELRANAGAWRASAASWA